MSDQFRPPPFHPARPQLIRPVRLDPTGRHGPTRGQAKGSRWRRTSHGLYLPTDVNGTLVEQRIVEAAAVVPDGGGAVTGWAALRWVGGRWFDGSTPHDPIGLPVQLAMWSDIRGQAGISVCEEGIDPRDVITVDGLPITIPARSVCFLMRYAGEVREAVRAFDMAAYNDLVSLEEMWAYANALGPWTGIPQCREGLALGDENSWSPQEVTMRLIWTNDAGLPKPLMNVPVFDRQGRLLGAPDLLDVEAGVAGEYEGVVHLDRARRTSDVLREEAFRNVGLEFFTVLGGDAADRPRMAERMLAARSRARWLPADQRAWTIEPPPWWTPTVTVEQRRRLSEQQRARWLGHRAA